MLPTVPTFVQRIFPKLVWKYIDDHKIYLTFDDGPVPEATLWVLDLLKTYDIKATFFCVGENVSKHPKIYQRILDEGHAVGNHSYNHLYGWKTATKTYVENVQKASEVIDSPLFRPPYGKITPTQSKVLQSLGYKIVMWDVLTMDYDKTKSPQDCLAIAKKHTKPGSIIVCHDSEKAMPNLMEFLPEFIEYCLQQKWVFAKVE